MYAQVYGKFLADNIAAIRAAWCWFKSDLESAGMWSIYGHQGTAIMTDRNRLRAALPAAKEFKISEIYQIYRDPLEKVETSMRNLHMMMLLELTEWSWGQ